MSTVRRLKTKKSVDPQMNASLFLQYQAGRGLVPKTINVQRNILDILLAQVHCDFNDVSAMTQVVAKVLAGKNEAYYNKMLTTYRQFFEYLIAEEILLQNPVTRFKYRRETSQIVFHSEETIRKFLNLIDKATFAGLRDYTFCILMLDTGIRPSEAVQICIDDISVENMQVRVRKEYAKTRRERTLPISVQTLHLLQKLISLRADDWRYNVPIICAYDGRKLATTGIRDRFEDYSRMLGTRITPYHLRHSFALYFIKNGGDAFALQRIMGHAKLDMTRVYVNLGSDDVAEKHKQATPLHNFINSKRVINIKKR